MGAEPVAVKRFHTIASHAEGETAAPLQPASGPSSRRLCQHVYQERAVAEPRSRVTYRDAIRGLLSAMLQIVDVDLIQHIPIAMLRLQC